ncbi:sporulation protein YlmC with PRC-barrel domain [Actinoplanes lutulentus]|uniref:Uncharacterized protein DUF2382 n=1 Tax=Actinoplanes lutulentus TaxID=1287878 RepID=A0A327Z9P2_9ACTN|nr:PRC-barrel domain-containing protein [Actinoplanes lutulentus]MBB2947151.1 sporulation protein YlmC with PRC-barrel domain [Actinoplanes lutulentus]RAK36427.1 uncharacterized protein DUF2382 [Actinoplanes lutulentus]
MITQNDIARLTGADVYDTDGDKVGSVGEVYLDAQGGDPQWVTVRTGLFGTKETFVPLRAASYSGDRITVSYPKGKIKDAPRIDADGAVSPAEEAELYTYYGLRDGDTTAGRHAAAGYGASYDDSSAASGTARLRKYVVTEQQPVSEPVAREETAGDEGRDRR